MPLMGKCAVFILDRFFYLFYFLFFLQDAFLPSLKVKNTLGCLLYLWLYKANMLLPDFLKKAFPQGFYLERYVIKSLSWHFLWWAVAASPVSAPFLSTTCRADSFRAQPTPLEQRGVWKAIGFVLQCWASASPDSVSHFYPMLSISCTLLRQSWGESSWTHHELRNKQVYILVNNPVKHTYDWP